MKGLLISLLFLVIATTTIADEFYYRYEPPDDCQSVKCPRPLCANPVTPEGECCPSCEHSECKFEGCVQFLGKPGSKTVQWKPDGCITCICTDNTSLCYGFGCPPVYPPVTDPCLGRPQITSPTECCIACDFGIPEKECAVVPDRSLTYELGMEEFGSMCSVALTFHRCDKRGFIGNGGRRFECRPVVRRRSVKLSRDSDSVSGSCGAVEELTYSDVVRCLPVRNDDIDIGCDILVD